MNKAFTLLFMLIVASFGLQADTVTLEQCVEMAHSNYPLIKKYDLLSSTNEIELSDINKAWLPRIGVTGQVTLQNAVPSYPETLKHFLSQAGQKIDGLGKLQYKVGVEITQNIWDGGVINNRRDVQKTATEVQNEALKVEIYTLIQRVNNLYFAILLTEEQIEINKNTLALINVNLRQLESMLKNGIAMQSDVDMLAAQSLTLEQNLAQMQSSLRGYRKMLGIFTGENMSDCVLEIPNAEMPVEMESARPELDLFRSKLALIKTTQRLSDTSVMPKIGLFAQSYYGYPGFDYFKSMMQRDLSFNLMAGVRVSWNIDSFYTRKSSQHRSAINEKGVEVDMDVFKFNTDMQVVSARESIKGLHEMMSKDQQIISLCRRVRESAESQLRNGVIDATALLSKINDENRAELMARYHKLQLIQEIYNLKYILNR